MRFGGNRWGTPAESTHQPRTAAGKALAMTEAPGWLVVAWAGRDAPPSLRCLSFGPLIAGIDAIATIDGMAASHLLQIER